MGVEHEVQGGKTDVVAVPPGALAATDSHSFGCFAIQATDQRIAITHRDHPDRPLWSTSGTGPIVRVSRGDATVTETRGFFQVKDVVEPFIDGDYPDRVERHGVGPTTQGTSSRTWIPSAKRLCESVVLSGRLGPKQRWRLEFSALDEVQIGFELSTTCTDYNRIELNAAMEPSNRVFGFGEQFTHLDMKGRKVPILSQEPGIGRGVQPLTWLMNLGFKAGGDWHNTNAPAPWYLTTDLQGLCLENHEHSSFDFTDLSQVRVSVFAPSLRGRVFYGDTPLSLVEAYTRFAGRMRRLPEWVDRGAIIGMQGGTDAVEEMRARLESAGAPIAAFWLQDWVGARKTSIGWQLWWNWELDRERYPRWDGLVSDLKAAGVRVLTYLNPFLVDAQEKGTHRRNLYAEALEGDFLIKRGGEPYQILNTSFSAAMLDLANPAACAWIKDVIKTELIATGASGWMADFGEALPFDAELHGKADAAQFHNEYPEVWARINREAIQEAGLDDEIVFFMRSGYTRSPRYNTLFWMGDQLTSWSREDGIKSTVIGLLSSGMSGFSLNHSDIGGYTATTIPWLPFKIPGLGYTRGRELLHRWIELNAFTPVFRTHEGNQPARHYQIDGDDETLQHFARFARVYAALGEYRRGLAVDAADRGHPLIRHPWLHYPDDPHAQSLELQFMLGPDVMVAPVLNAKRDRVTTYLPPGRWRHLWTGELCELADGAWFDVAAPPGAPAVFCRADSAVDMTVRNTLSTSDDLGAAIPNLLQPATHHPLQPTTRP